MTTLTKQLKTNHPLYETYRCMLRRCNNPMHIAYPNYGGRGISVCPEWEEDFWTFVDNVGERPEGHTLDRINNDGNYEPTNIRWSSPSEQQTNTRQVKEAKGFYQRPDSRYVSNIRVDNKTVYLGTFECPLLARLAYEDALKKKLAGLPVN